MIKRECDEYIDVEKMEKKRCKIKQNEIKIATRMESKYNKNTSDKRMAN